MEASLELVKGSWSGVFTTSNHLVPGRRIEIGLREGPFRHLEGVWLFESGGAGGRAYLRRHRQFPGGLLRSPGPKDL